MKLLIQYDGTNFHGWQIQPTGPTIQGTLTEALSRLDKRPVVVQGAGRTDAGVHAEGQVASFIFHRLMSEEELCRALNGNLPWEIRIREVEFVDPSFEAQFSARAKTYRYTFFLGKIVSPFSHRYVYHCLYPLNVERIHQLLSLLKGEHDFAAFSSQGKKGRSTIRRIDEIHLVHEGDFLRLHITANGFLRGMARRIAGTVQEVGRGKVSIEEVEASLLDPSTGNAGPSLPAKGLTLMRVDY